MEGVILTIKVGLALFAIGVVRQFFDYKSQVDLKAQLTSNDLTNEDE